MRGAIPEPNITGPIGSLEVEVTPELLVDNSITPAFYNIPAVLEKHCHDKTTDADIMKYNQQYTHRVNISTQVPTCGG